MEPKFRRVDKFVVKVTVHRGREWLRAFFLLNEPPEGGLEIDVDEALREVSLSTADFTTFASFMEVGIDAEVPPS